MRLNEKKRKKEDLRTRVFSGSEEGNKEIKKRQQGPTLG